MKNIKLTEIAQRIIDAVLEERFINKENLEKRILPILKVWMKKADGIKESKRKPASVHKLQWTVRAKDIDNRYWKNALKKEIGEEAMKKYYDAQADYLRENDALDYQEPKQT